MQIEAPQANNPLNCNGDDYLIFRGLEFYMGKSNGIVVAGGTTGLEVDDCILAYSTNGLLIFDVSDVVGSDMTFTRSEFMFNKDAGISMLEENNDITFRGNHIHDNCLLGTAGGNVGGINIKSDDLKQSDNVVVEYNLIENNGESGVANTTGFGAYIDTLGTGLAIRGNTISGSNADGLVLEWTDSGTVENNVVHSSRRHGYAFIRRCNSNTINENTSYNNGIADSSGSNFLFNGVSEGPAQTESDNVIKNNVGYAANGKEIRVHSGWVNDGTNGSGNVYANNTLADQTGTWHNWNGSLYQATAPLEYASGNHRPH